MLSILWAKKDIHTEYGTKPVLGKYYGTVIILGRLEQKRHAILRHIYYDTIIFGRLNPVNFKPRNS